MTAKDPRSGEPRTGQPRTRAALDAIPAYVPGKRGTSTPGRAAYKLSSNENPAPPPRPVLDAAHAALADPNRYPDMAATDLVAAIASYHDVPAGDVVPATGSVAALYHVLQATCADGDDVVFAWRSFEAYPIAVQVTGARSVRVPLGAGTRHDLPAMAAAVGPRTRAVLVCTPNNPTGPAAHADELREFCAAVPAETLVVIDEAYADFVRDGAAASGVALYREFGHVAVLRTLSKAYSLAGLRIGYLLAHEPVAAAARKCALPFGVSTVAQAAGVAALEHATDIAGAVAAIVAERDRVRAGLLAIGYDVPDAQGNFVWLPLRKDTGAFAAACAAAGVTVRPFAGAGCRVSIGEPVANDVVLRVAGDFARTDSGHVLAN